MTLTIVISGPNPKAILDKLTKADVSKASNLLTAPDGSTLDWAWHERTYETMAAYHNAAMEEAYGAPTGR